MNTNYHNEHVPQGIDVWYNNRAEPRDDVMISVVIPVFKEEKLLPRLLECLTDELRSRFRLEVIVSDGGSNDSTVSIAKEHADVVVTHTEQRRQTIAEGRNKGAEFAQGRTIVFINADTIPAEATVFFSHILSWANREGKYHLFDALACPVEVIPSERKWSDVVFHNFFNNYLKMLSMLGIGVGRGECQIISKEIFTSIGGYNAQLAAGEDFDLFMRIAKRKKIAVANELLVYESPRRYRRYGYRKILWSWFMNWFGATFLKKSISKEWEPVR